MVDHPHFAARRLYYGEWLPNTYFAKVDSPSIGKALRGLSEFAYSIGFVQPTSIPLGAGGLILRIVRDGVGRCWVDEITYRQQTTDPRDF